MAGLQGKIDLGGWRTGNLGGRLLLVLAGGLLTMSTQSSSATVAAAITALNTSIVTVARSFAVQIGASGEKESDGGSIRISISLHLVDHIERLSGRLRDIARMRTAREHPSLASQASTTAELLNELAIDLGGELRQEMVKGLEVMAADLESATHGKNR